MTDPSVRTGQLMLPRVDLAYRFTDDNNRREVRLSPRTICDYETEYDCAWNGIWMKGSVKEVLWVIWKQGHNHIDFGEFLDRVEPGSVVLLDDKRALTMRRTDADGNPIEDRDAPLSPAQTEAEMIAGDLTEAAEQTPQP